MSSSKGDKEKGDKGDKDKGDKDKDKEPDNKAEVKAEVEESNKPETTEQFRALYSYTAQNEDELR